MTQMTFRRRSILPLLFLLGALLLAGCRRTPEKTPEMLQILSGASQYGAKGDATSRMVEIEVLGPLRPSAGRRRPVPNVLVRIDAAMPLEGEEPIEGTTDETGVFRAHVPYGTQFGDRYYVASCPEHEEIKPVNFHVTAGVAIRGNGQQLLAGNELPEPISVEVDGPNGREKGTPVYFKLVAGPHDAVLTNPNAVTDKNGVASTQLIAAEGYSGKYEIVAEIGVKDGVGHYMSRGLTITALALDRWGLTLAMLGGLAFFILGMKFMSDGLQLLAGAKLKSILQMFTGNRFVAMLAGVGVTAIIQSSGATSVMVVGFVNAGLLSLQQGLGVIMGSSIGTTVTGQLVSFDLSALALPSIVAGVLLMLLVRKSGLRGVAMTIMGFGMLFYGMVMMAAQSKIIADFPSFQSFFSLFDCTPREGSYLPPLLPVLGTILIGAVATMAVQSSSVTVSLAIVLSAGGLLNFWTAFPLVLGNNIGSTMTGLLATIGTNRTAKQVAVASVVFKCFGVILMLLLMLIPWDGVPCFMRFIDVVTPGDVFDPLMPQNVGRHIANAHSLFSLFAVIAFLPFTSFLAWVSRHLVPEDSGKGSQQNAICRLEPHLLNSPSAALDQVLGALLSMTREAMTLTHGALESFADCTHVNDEKLGKMEEQIDFAQHDIMDYLVKLTRRGLSENQSAVIPALMHCVNDIERTGDRAINILQLVNNREQVTEQFSEEAIVETRQIGRHLADAGDMLIEGLSRNDQVLIDKVIKHCSEIKMMAARFEGNHESRLHTRDCNVENGVIYVEMLSNLERIAGHLSNVAERARKILPHRMQFAGYAG